MTSPEIVYHYTSFNVLNSILKNNSVWLTGKHHLNDPDEGDIIFKLLDKYERDEGVNLDEFRKDINSYDFFVNCMTTHGDKLSQWRGYGDQGKGVSIGFDFDLIKKHIKGSKEILLKKVEYIKKSTPCIPDDVFKSFEAAKKRRNSIASASDEYLHTIKKDQCSLKYDSYAEEDEYRLIYTTKEYKDKIIVGSKEIGHKKYIEINGAIREYYELKIEKEIIKKIYIGPKSRNQDMRVMNRFLDSMGFSHVSVELSDLNFR